MESSNVTEITIRKELAKSQVVAEIKLPTAGGATKVLGVNTSLSLAVTECFNGEVRISGSETVNLMYQTEESFYGVTASVDFTDRVECAVSPSTKAKVFGRVLDTDIVAIEDDGVRVASVIEITVFEAAAVIMPAPEMPDGVFGNEEHIKCSSLAACFSVKTAIESDEVFKAESLLSACARAYVTGADSALDSVIVIGEVVIDVCGKSGDGTASGEIIIPFTEEVPALGARNGDVVAARVCVCKVGEVETAEGFTFAVTLQLDGEAYCRSSADIVSDAFSVSCELEKETGEFQLSDIKLSKFIAVKAEGSVMLGEGDSADSVIALTGFEFVSENAYIDFDKVVVEGALSGTIVYYDADAAAKKTAAALIPVRLVTNVECEEGDSFDVSGSVGKISVKLRRSGEIDIKADIMLGIVVLRTIGVCALCSIDEGEKEECDCGAISVYIASDNESLWECAKALKVKPDTVSAQNPELEFPLKKGEKIVIYRNM